MTIENLEAAIQDAGGAVKFLRNHNARAHTLPVVAEHTNWQAEQQSWRDSVALMDQSHHMTDLFLRGPDSLRLLSDLGVNSFKNFGPNKAKQFIVTSPDGYYIGDVILFHLPDGMFNLVGREIVMDWVLYHLETGDYDATAERDDNTAVRARGKNPVFYRYELQGPNANALVERALGAPVPEVRFFSMATFLIAGHEVHALRHGMAGQPGYELFGPWADGADVLAALLQAGEGLDLKRVGAKAYSTANLSSGWVPPTLPAIFSGEETRGFREWLPTDNIGALGGSLNFDRIEDYYLTPHDLGYDYVVSFDHEFIGREALEKRATETHRKKVTLVWDPRDVARAFGTLFDAAGDRAKIITLPKARYALYQKDAVLIGDQVVGASMDVGYISNEQAFVSLASVDVSAAETGTEVTVLWGENPISTKANIEPHAQIAIRATVAPAPYHQYAREAYRDK